MATKNQSGLQIPQSTRDSTINLALDTLAKGKQALIFVNSKRAAEKQAEDLSKKTGIVNQSLAALSEEVQGVLDRPTQQCERLAKCVRNGVAFHHAGLAARQKEIVEENFRTGVVKVICCTPTLAYGLDLPAFRSIIRDARRFGHRGMDFIPVLEYLQMAGRAGRPKYDSHGEAILIADTEPERDELVDRYVNGEPEEIFSKLAVEPVLRTYLLSLIAARFVRTRKELISFFARTFWAHQFKDMRKLEGIIDKMLSLLQEWDFVSCSRDDFVQASSVDDPAYTATLVGKRVAELYLDPLTAHQLRRALLRAKDSPPAGIFPWLHILCRALEMRPLPSVRQKEFEFISQKLALVESSLLEREPSLYDPDYDDYLASIKQAMVLDDWCGEVDEEKLLESHGVRPGELRAKLSRLDWLLYASQELAVLLGLQSLVKDLRRVRTRAKYGVKEELLPLVRLEGIGRFRARALFRNGIKDVGDVKAVDAFRLGSIVGPKVAKSLKHQVGEGCSEVPLEDFERNEAPSKYGAP